LSKNKSNPQQKRELVITKKTRAIFVAHLVGFPADIQKIKKIIGKRKIILLEDCCESQGAKIKGKKVGNFGIGGSFSFYWGHHMSTIEGGMITTDDEDFYNRCKYLRDHAMSKEKRYWHTAPGFNFRMTNIQAAIGLAQVEQVDLILKKKRYIYEFYYKHLKDVVIFQEPINEMQNMMPDHMI
jgi:dTDP-4-amino-4,6-dideoxygalactose transaminase